MTLHLGYIYRVAQKSKLLSQYNSLLFLRHSVYISSTKNDHLFRQTQSTMENTYLCFDVATALTD